MLWDEVYDLPLHTGAEWQGTVMVIVTLFHMKLCILVPASDTFKKLKNLRTLKKLFKAEIQNSSNVKFFTRFASFILAR